MAVNYSAMQLVTCPYLPVKGDLAIFMPFLPSGTDQSGNCQGKNSTWENASQLGTLSLGQSWVRAGQLDALQQMYKCYSNAKTCYVSIEWMLASNSVQLALSPGSMPRTVLLVWNGKASFQACHGERMRKASTQHHITSQIMAVHCGFMAFTKLV